MLITAVENPKEDPGRPLKESNASQNVTHRQVKLAGNHHTSVDNIREHCQPAGEPAFTFLKSTPQVTTHLTPV